MRDIAKRLRSLRNKPPPAQTKWPRKLKLARSVTSRLPWRHIYIATFTSFLTPFDREPFLKLLHRQLYTGSYEGRICPRCKRATFSMLHMASCPHASYMFSLADRLISSLQGSVFNPNPRPLDNPTPPLS